MRKPVLLVVLIVMSTVAAGVGSSSAGDFGDNSGGAVKLLTTVPVPTSLSPLRAFDISWIDPVTQRYYLSDRSNASVDVVDAKTNTFLGQIKASPPFAGVVLQPNPSGPGFVADNNRSGPNGVASFGRWLFVSDAPSRVVSFDLSTNPPTQVSDVSTGGADSFRADELAYDPKDGVLLVVNNADSPPFATLITVDKQTGKLTVGPRVTFDKAHVGFDATNGAEQPAWDPSTGKFYQSIPEVNGPGDGTGANGGVARINPHTGALEVLFPVSLCQPAGLTVGPHDDLLLGCSVVFDTAGQAWTATDSNTAAPISVIMDAKTGKIDRNVAGVSGNDEVWFNRGDGRYYLAARNNPTGPVLGVIDADRQSLVQLVPTINTAGKPTASPVVVSGSSHSVAVDPQNNHAFVPLPANNVFPDCLNGCFGVFGTPDGDDHD
ncbi:MAG TPA: hypothetical protein VMS64_31190 [Candidatus Methylomirabilis sp.]|nr:hypothetical protein [Candidatus Methylomirabilis sp.]